jgi:hypothetical protein
MIRICLDSLMRQKIYKEFKSEKETKIMIKTKMKATAGTAGLKFSGR